MDQAVLQTQAWVNKTYCDNPDYRTVLANGVTGWPTMKALTIALQIELKIESPNGSFGPATRSAFQNLSINSKPSDGASDAEISSLKNRISILQGALYCKGYNPTGITGTFGTNTENAVKQLQSDAGISPTGVVDATLMKALLTMDAFTLLQYGSYNGDPKIRQVQQYLNKNYISNTYFSADVGLVPCDGIYGRSTNKALLYALQIEEGIPVPNGVFGPSTKSKCPVLSVGSGKIKFIYLLQFALYCNGKDFYTDGFDGIYDNDVKSSVTKFQNFCALYPDGVTGMQTWASLLVSTGDSARKGTACDCSTTITKEKALTLKSNGYNLVGRYLSGKYKMTPVEIQTILNGGLSIFPIFETGGYELSYFSEAQGSSDGYTATTVAKNLGFPDGTIIYFTVDFDALDGDVTSSILPYFKNVSDKFKSINSTYKIGIYAPRNVCSRVSSNGYSCSSFVCDMSTGFSGNLGYRLPDDWTIDQISTVTKGSGTGTIEIDNNISRGRNTGVSYANSTIEDTPELLQLLDMAAEEFYQCLVSPTSPINTIRDRNRGVLNLLRYYRYNYKDFTWLVTLPDSDLQFINFVQNNSPHLMEKLMPYIQLINTIPAYIHDKDTDLPHLAATALGYDSSPIVPDFWTGWGGDLATAMRDVTKLLNRQDEDIKSGSKKESDKKTVAELATEVIGSPTYSCCRTDIENDIDSIYLAENISSDKLGKLLINYFENVDGETRKNIMFKNLGFNGTPTLEELNDKISSIMVTGINGINKLGGLPLKKLAIYTFKDTLSGKTQSIEPTKDVANAIVYAFADYILNTL